MRMATVSLVIAIGTAVGASALAFEQHRELARLSDEVADRDSARGIGQAGLWKAVQGMGGDLHEIREDLYDARARLRALETRR